MPEPAHQPQSEAASGSLPRVDQDSKLLVDYVALKSAELASDKLQTRDDQRARRFGLALSLAGLIGFTSISFILQSLVSQRVTEQGTELQVQLERLEDDLETRLQQAETRLTSSLDNRLRTLTEAVTVQVDAQTEKVAELEPRLEDTIERQASKAVGAEVTLLEERLEREVAFQQFAYLALSLDIKTEFSRAESEAVLGLIRQLAPHPDIVNRDEFPVLVEKCIDAFAQAGLTSHIAEFEELLEPTIQRSQGILHTFIAHYGRRAAFYDATAEATERFIKYAQAGDRFSLQPLVLAYRLLLQTKKNVSDAEAMESLLLQAAFLDEEATAVFLVELHSLSHQAFWQGRTTYEGGVATQISNRLWKTYGPQLEALEAALPDGGGLDFFFPVLGQKAEPERLKELCVDAASGRWIGPSWVGLFCQLVAEGSYGG